MFRIPLVATFRAAILVLASVEILAFGAAVGSRSITWRDAVATALKLAVLGGAYVALAA